MDSEALDTSAPAKEATPRRLTLRKGEKLRHRTLVDSLFTKGESLYEFPFRVNFRLLSREELENSFRSSPPSPIDPIQMLITVPKKKRRRAVDRVLMRRRIREAYRLNRLPLKDLVESMPGGNTLCMAFIYIHDKNNDFSLIDRKMKSLLRKVADKIWQE
ncbi:MAG: ribonuclease P protein component [Muribaculaceae bacterium]|nr:ribonuclease P protein component [Muribaculaceae bacterium]MDE7109415.1 ribonuclease P protein component [Muribaculaceae bacterium]